jgi:hypothetical protein
MSGSRTTRRRPRRNRTVRGEVRWGRCRSRGRFQARCRGVPERTSSRCIHGQGSCMRRRPPGAWAASSMSSHNYHSCLGRCLGSRMRRHTWIRADPGRRKHRPDTPDRAHSCSRSGRTGTSRSRGQRNPHRMRSALRRTYRGTRQPRRPRSPRMRPCSCRSGSDRRSDPYRPRCTRRRRTTGARTVEPRRRSFPLPRLPNHPRAAVRVRRRSATYARRPGKKATQTEKPYEISARSPYRQAGKTGAEVTKALWLAASLRGDLKRSTRRQRGGVASGERRHLARQTPRCFRFRL